MMTKMELQHSLQFLEVDLKKAKTKGEIANIKKKIKDTKEKIAKKGGRKSPRGTRRGTRRN
jgi:uncharacterized protein YeeX (DUF496 family)